MPFSFQLPTTSQLAFSSHVTSASHPSLPQAATTQHNILRDVLKKHKRLPPQSRASSLSVVIAALDEYIPYLLTLDAGLAGKAVNGETVDVTLRNEVYVEWRSTLSSSIPGREPPRIKGKGINYEVNFVLTILAYTYTLLARSLIHTLFVPITPTPEQRTQVILPPSIYSTPILCSPIFTLALWKQMPLTQ